MHDMIVSIKNCNIMCYVIIGSMMSDLIFYVWICIYNKDYVQYIYVHNLLRYFIILSAKSWYKL